MIANLMSMGYFGGLIQGFWPMLSVKLKQNEAHVEKIGTTELSAILEEELNLKGAFGVRSLFVDSQSKVWKSAETMSINTEEWWPPENGRQQMDRYGDQRWRNITVIE
jgi:hypothetical protein